MGPIQTRSHSLLQFWNLNQTNKVLICGLLRILDRFTSFAIHEKKLQILYSINFSHFYESPHNLKINHLIA